MAVFRCRQPRGRGSLASREVRTGIWIPESHRSHTTERRGSERRRFIQAIKQRYLENLVQKRNSKNKIIKIIILLAIITVICPFMHITKDQHCCASMP